MSKQSTSEAYAYEPSGNIASYLLLVSIGVFVLSAMNGWSGVGALMMLCAYVLQAIVTAEAARRKSRSFVAFIIIALLAPPLAWFVVAVVSPVMAPVATVASAPVIPEAVERKCPFCAEAIRREAILCRWCGRDLPVAEA